MQLLQQVRIIDPVQQVDRLADVLIIDGKIKLINDQITDYPAQASIIQPSGLVLGTGLVDLYSHSSEPGNETRETLLELSQAGAMGGFTQLGILPDTIPAIDSAEVIAAVKHKGDRFNLHGNQSTSLSNLPRLNFWGAAYSQTHQTMNALAELEPEIVGFTTQHNLSNLHLFKQILEYVQPGQKPVAIALHQNELAGAGVVREGNASIRYGMSGSPGFSEAAIIAAVLEIVAEIPTPIHIMRVSTKRGVELIADAKARGVKVSASTTWMHLLWDSDAIGSYNPNLRLEPPLGNESDRIALVDGVRQGIIDAIAIDHQAYTYEEKTVAFALAPPGVVGLELALPLLWQKFVKSGAWSAIELWQALSSRPRQCIQQHPIAIANNQGIDLVLFDPEKKWLANQDNLKSPAANTPWYNQEITGKVIKTMSSK
ncbi:MAG: dihydroorotase [Pleurocapsa sp. SU_5_0]|nr:dihydroorotase [Pleurocapsa sp. SU_5_0]NJO97590.1 dihydroorotase [Pleurocapsa sp. CRU_1_2]NJR46770.1 dihydroorotase [Hyellaceae cyanobacterium CSU_1_1]